MPAKSMLRKQLAIPVTQENSLESRSSLAAVPQFQRNKNHKVVSCSNRGISLESAANNLISFSDYGRVPNISKVKNLKPSPAADVVGPGPKRSITSNYCYQGAAVSGPYENLETSANSSGIHHQ